MNKKEKAFEINVSKAFSLIISLLYRYQPISTFYFEIPKYLILYVFETSFKVLILTCNN